MLFNSRRSEDQLSMYYKSVSSHGTVQGHSARVLCVSQKAGAGAWVVLRRVLWSDIRHGKQNLSLYSEPILCEVTKRNLCKLGKVDPIGSMIVASGCFWFSLHNLKSDILEELSFFRRCGGWNLRRLGESPDQVKTWFLSFSIQGVCSPVFAKN